MKPESVERVAESMRIAVLGESVVKKSLGEFGPGWIARDGRSSVTFLEHCADHQSIAALTLNGALTTLRIGEEGVMSATGEWASDDVAKLATALTEIAVS